jgi:hypothetical protein
LGGSEAQAASCAASVAAVAGVAVLTRLGVGGLPARSNVATWPKGENDPRQDSARLPGRLCLVGKAHRLAVLAAAAVAASGCASTASTTTDPTHGISRICRQRLSRNHNVPPRSEAEDLAQFGEVIRLNEQVVTRIRRLALPPSLRREVDASLLPAIIRVDKDAREFTRTLRSDDYKRAYFLNLEVNRLADEVTTIARRLRLAGCY